MACRCSDISKMEEDQITLWNIAESVGVLAVLDETVVTDTEHLSNVCDASFFTKANFAERMKKLSDPSTTNIAALKTKVDNLKTQLDSDLESARKEDKDYHDSQKKKK
ncbi:MAG: hypothetical protein K6G10_09890 [Butyrivibrio sp.]|nr:hypothetical protein [Butyrivibrio sp.]